MEKIQRISFISFVLFSGCGFLSLAVSSTLSAFCFGIAIGIATTNISLVIENKNV